MGWNLLSYKKKVAASSSLEGYEPELANDEQVETWWAAQTGNKGEWLQIDLGEPMDVKAIQVNFAIIISISMLLMDQWYINIILKGR